MPPTRRPAPLLLNPVLHQQARLAIASILAARGESTFNELKEALATTDGNLASHLKALTRAGYVETEKAFRDARPLTTYGLTAKGRYTLGLYLETLERVIKEARS